MNRQIGLILTGLAFTIAGYASAGATGGSEPLAVFLGRWEIHGQMMSSILGPSAEIKANADCGWSPTHTFLLCDILGSNQPPSLTVYTRDPRTGQYRYYQVTSTDAPPHWGNLMVRDNTWTFSGEFRTAESTVRIRTTDHFDSADHISWRIEYQVDGGPWNVAGTGENLHVEAR